MFLIRSLPGCVVYVTAEKKTPRFRQLYGTILKSYFLHLFIPGLIMIFSPLSWLWGLDPRYWVSFFSTSHGGEGLLSVPPILLYSVSCCNDSLSLAFSLDLVRLFLLLAPGDTTSHIWPTVGMRIQNSTMRNIIQMPTMR